MIEKELNFMLRTISNRKILSISILIIFSLSVSSQIFHHSLISYSDLDDSHSSTDLVVPRLKSSSYLDYSENFPLNYSDIDSQRLNITDSHDTEILNNEYFPISFKTYNLHDVRIDKISPEAMQNDTSFMTFLINFTIIDSPGWGSNAFSNLTINNLTSNYDITTWRDWTELPNETGQLEGNYSLMFDLDNSILDILALGSYNLTLTTNVSSQVSNDTILLPMTYLDVTIEEVSPTIFNIAQDTQDFNFSIHLQEIRNMSEGLVDVTGDLPVDIHNPNVTLVSNHTSHAGKSVQLDITGNITTDDNGEYNFTATLPLNDTSATWFDLQNHTMLLSITSPYGTNARDAWVYKFEAVETVLLLNITTISVTLNSSISYEDLGEAEKTFRLNFDEYINITYYIYDNSTKIVYTDPVIVSYQDPDDPLNPFALEKVAVSGGSGTINLTSNVLSPSSGVYLLIHVKGHKISQNLTNTAYLVAYWDKLKYEYTYYDDRGETGSEVTFNQKALGVDINETWEIEVAVLYASDDSPAKGVQISYSFEGIPGSLTDGVTPDTIEDGLIKFSYRSLIASTINFSCQINNVTSSNGGFFVDETLYSAIFSFNVTWTYLKVSMIPAEVDHRLGTGKLTDIDFIANWAHDNSSFNGILRALNLGGSEKDVFITNGVGSWQGLVKPFPNLYNYSVLSIVDGPYGITKFTTPEADEPDDRNVQTYIIWDDVYFSFSNDNQTWGENFFYTPFGENATLFCHARYFYDNEPFSGTAALFDLDDTSIYNVTFYDGYGLWTGNRSDAYRAVDFQFSGIIEDVNYGVTQIHGTPVVTLIWDIILVLLRTDNRTYLHGSYANISVTLKYRISDYDCDPTQVMYDLLLSNETSSRTNVTLTHFLDFSIKSDIHWYSITGIFDNITGLTAFEVEYEWFDQDMEPEKGDLAVFWIDNEDPTILEIHTYDLGNGTILIIVDATDNSETWEGSGISDVSLIDNRSDPGFVFPLPADEYILSEGIYRYIFKFNYNQTVPGWGDTFGYEFNELLSFTVVVTDTGTPTYPDDLGTRTTSSGLFSITANYDPFYPQFIFMNENAINITYLTVDTSYNLTDINDGDVIITVFVQDYGWSGLNENSIQLTVFDQENNTLIDDTMKLQGGDLGERGREILEYTWIGNLPVFEACIIIVNVTDNAGNTHTRISEIVIEDNVAPRITNVELGITPDRKIRVTVTLEEAGLGVEYVMVEVIEGGTSKFYNLTIQGGTGGSVANGLQILTYSAIIPLDFSVFDFFISKTYSINFIVSDRIGNQKYYNTEDLDRLDMENIATLLSLLQHYWQISLLISAILIITAVIVGIKVFSKTEGYDMKKIITESAKISRETILTQMDEYALGVTVNFFDQVQGPVPVIWEPPLLEDQEQVMLDLSDKSFSTLEFIGSEETERSGIFDFSTGSYDCTALGYSFAVVNPEARGGKENLTIVLLLRKEWGDNLLTFQDELVEKLREIRQMIEGQNNPTQIEKQSRQLREFVSRLMISFNKLYTGTKYESEHMVE